MIRRVLVVAMSLCLVLSAAAAAFAAVDVKASADTAQVPMQADSFGEEIIERAPGAEVTFSYEAGGRSGGGCVSIENRGYAYARLRACVTGLRPNEIYIASVYIKGEGVTPADGQSAKGATLSTTPWAASPDKAGTFGWERVEYYLKSEADGSTDLCLNLGGYGAQCSGKAWFDGLEIHPMNAENQFASEHIRLSFPDAALFSGGAWRYDPADIQDLVGQLDRLYVAYEELTGYAPYGGERIDGIAGNSYPAGMYAGNAFELLGSADAVLSEMPLVNFGLIHEIGHDFDHPGWTFHAEMTANLKACYAADRAGLRSSSYADEKGSLSDGFEALFEETYERYFGDYESNTCTFNHDALMYIFLKVKDEVSWEPFKQTFRWFVETGTNPEKNSEKFALFIQKLSEYSGRDIQTEFFPAAIWYTCMESELTNDVTVTYTPPAKGDELPLEEIIIDEMPVVPEPAVVDGPPADVVVDDPVVADDPAVVDEPVVAEVPAVAEEPAVPVAPVVEVPAVVGVEPAVEEGPAVEVPAVPTVVVPPTVEIPAVVGIEDIIRALPAEEVPVVSIPAPEMPSSEELDAALQDIIASLPEDSALRDLIQQPDAAGQAEDLLPPELADFLEQILMPGASAAFAALITPEFVEQLDQLITYSDEDISPETAAQIREELVPGLIETLERALPAEFWEQLKGIFLPGVTLPTDKAADVAKDTQGSAVQKTPAAPAPAPADPVPAAPAPAQGSQSSSSGSTTYYPATQPSSSYASPSPSASAAAPAAPVTPDVIPIEEDASGLYETIAPETPAAEVLEDVKQGEGIFSDAFLPVIWFIAIGLAGGLAVLLVLRKRASESEFVEMEWFPDSKRSR
ncbi:MAG: M60 family metallopeptidase [Clostridiales Family XIII bacterium]|jgi:hypothetical protein|nr:M60 family metallopeptidase [Clostridiales Family XIII bacterium]